MELEFELEIFDDNDDLLNFPSKDKDEKKTSDKKESKQNQKSSDKDND